MGAIKMDGNHKASAVKCQKICSHCHKPIMPKEIYHFRAVMLCEDCCIDLRSSRPRKTHWQYIRSIKGDYLIPGENG